MNNEVSRLEQTVTDIDSHQESAQLYQLLLENTHDLISIHRLADLSYEYVNPATLRTLGYTMEELFKLSALELIHPEDMERVLKLLKENLPKGEGHDEFRCRKKDGSYVWLEVTGNILPQESEDTLFIIISRDITDRKQMEEDLRISELRYRIVVEDQTELISRCKPDTTITFVNQAFCQAFDQQAEDLIGQSFLKLVPEQDHDDIRQLFSHFAPENPIFSRESTITSAEGELSWWEWTTRAIFSGGGEIVEYQVVARDITKHKDLEKALQQAHDALEEKVQERTAQLKQLNTQFKAKLDEQMRTETALREMETYYRALFEKAPAAISINRNGQTLFANQAYTSMFGYDRAAELIGTKTIDQVAPGCRRNINTKIKKREKGESLPPSHETLGLRKDGSTFPLFVQANNILLPDGPANVAFFADITERKQAETALQRQVEAQNILLDISKNFANIISFNMDAMINLALQRIGEFDHSDRSYVFLFSEDGSTMSNTHEWCAEGINPEIETLQDIPTSQTPWWMSNLNNRENINIPCVADLPPEAQSEKEILQAQDIQSILIVPMISEDKLIGFIGFDSVAREREWSQENTVILETVAQIITKGLQRKSYAEALDASENYYRTIFENTGAATLIIEEDMTISMVNDECARLLKCAKEDLIGKEWTDFIPPKKAEMMREYHLLRRIDPRAVPSQYETQMMDKYGHCQDGLLGIDLIPGTKKSAATFVDLTELKRIARALKAISAVNAAMIHTVREEELLDMVCEKIVQIGGYGLAWVGYVMDTPEQKVKSVSDAGHNHGYTNKLNIFLKDPKRGKGPTGTAIRTGQPVVCRNHKTDPDFKPWAKDALRRGFKSSMAIPLIENGKAFGALNIYSNEMGVFSSEEENLLIEMANDLAFAITSLRAKQNSKHVTRQLELSLGKMHRLLMQAVASLGTALDIRDPYTAGHQKKVVQIATAIAAEIGFSAERIEGITVAGNLHDIGKINVPSEILSKPGKLTPLEFEMIKTHSQAGYEIIKDIEFPWPVAEVLLQHHERLDGSGYPRGLAGDDILPEAKIMGVADVVEAMASHRPYRAALGIGAALEEIERNKGILYDPEVVDACVKLFREKGFQLE